MDTLRQNMFPSMQGVVDCLFGFNATVSTLFGATVNLWVSFLHGKLPTARHLSRGLFSRLPPKAKELLMDTCSAQLVDEGEHNI